MAEVLAASIKLTVSATLTGDTDLGSLVYNIPYSKTLSLSNGAGLNQANQIFTDTRTIAASTTEDLDLAGGLVNALGTTLTFTKIKAIIIAAATANTNNVVIGGDSNALVSFLGDTSDTIIIRPGGFICLAAPDATAYAVTASTGDILQVANSSSGSNVTYDIIIIGSV